MRTERKFCDLCARLQNSPQCTCEWLWTPPKRIGLSFICRTHGRPSEQLRLSLLENNPHYVWTTVSSALLKVGGWLPDGDTIQVALLLLRFTDGSTGMGRDLGWMRTYKRLKRRRKWKIHFKSCTNLYYTFITTCLVVGNVCLCFHVGPSS